MYRRHCIRCWPEFLFFFILLSSHLRLGLMMATSSTSSSSSPSNQRSNTNSNDNSVNQNENRNDNNNSNDEENNSMRFGRFMIPSSHIFYRTKQSAAFVNLRPIVPGHVLVMPYRIVPTMEELTDEEYIDLWKSVRIVQQVLKQQYGGTTTTTVRHPKEEEEESVAPPASLFAFNVAVQDGKAAGQTVPHVHVHILPRISGDFERNDDVYQALEEWVPKTTDTNHTSSSSTNIDAATTTTTTASSTIKKDRLHVPNDDERVDRTYEMMAEEAEWYRRILQKKESDNRGDV